MLAVTTGCSSSEASDALILEPVATSMPSTLLENSATSGPSETSTSSTTPPVVSLQGNYVARVFAKFPHDPLAYTQGLEWHEGWLYESTGQYGASDRRRIDPATGEIDLLVPLADELFGEGLTIVDDEVLQLTWREGELQRSGVDDLETRTTQRYEGEGWGLCHDGDAFFMSDGSSTLTKRNTTTFEATSAFEVTANGEPVALLNELECVGDQVFANVYGLDQIVAIDPRSGIVVAVIDASSLRPAELSADDLDFVLNGMAYQPEAGRWFLTGKYWPVLYEVEFVAD